MPLRIDRGGSAVMSSIKHHGHTPRKGLLMLTVIHSVYTYIYSSLSTQNNGRAKFGCFSDVQLYISGNFNLRLVQRNGAKLTRRLEVFIWTCVHFSHLTLVRRRQGLCNERLQWYPLDPDRGKKAVVPPLCALSSCRYWVYAYVLFILPRKPETRPIQFETI